MKGRCFQTPVSRGLNPGAALLILKVIIVHIFLPYDVGPSRAFLSEAEKTTMPKPHDVWFRPCIAGQIFFCCAVTLRIAIGVSRRTRTTPDARLEPLHCTKCGFSIDYRLAHRPEAMPYTRALVPTARVNIAGLWRSAPGAAGQAGRLSCIFSHETLFVYLTILTLNKVFETRPMHQDVLFRHFPIFACAVTIRVIFLALCNLHRDFGIIESIYCKYVWW